MILVADGGGVDLELAAMIQGRIYYGKDGGRTAGAAPMTQTDGIPPGQRICACIASITASRL